jgi:hypothetical protein
MEFVYLDDLFSRISDRVGKLELPRLCALERDTNRYSVSAFQCQGSIQADEVRIGYHGSSPNFVSKFEKFLYDGYRSNTDLLVAPEYSCPWEVIISSIQDGCFPNEGKLWALGAESINKEQIVQFRHLIEKRPQFIVSFDEDGLKSSRNYFNPLVYLFRTTNAEGEERKIILIQFKTLHMGLLQDEHNDFYGALEAENYIPGKEIYILRNNEHSIHLVSIICSDAFNFSPGNEAEKNLLIDKPFLILHPQLNPKPRYKEFKEYRNALFSLFDKKQILCVNWAEGTKIINAHKLGYPCTALYCFSQEVDLTDDKIHKNHENGGYIFFPPGRNLWFAYFLNGAELVHRYQISKVDQLGYISKLRGGKGPEFETPLTWNKHSLEFDELLSFENHHEYLKNEYGEDGVSLIPEITDFNYFPLDEERLLALSVGRIQKHNGRNWHSPRNIGLLQLSDAEESSRITFPNDDWENSPRNRGEVIASFITLCRDIITKGEYFRDTPFSLFETNAGNICFKQDEEGKVTLGYNLYCKQNRNGIIAIFLGHASKIEAEKKAKKLREALGQGNQTEKRVLVWYKPLDKIIGPIYDPTQPSIEADPFPIADSITNPESNNVQSN